MIVDAKIIIQVDVCTDVCRGNIQDNLVKMGVHKEAWREVRFLCFITDQMSTPADCDKLAIYNT